MKRKKLLAEIEAHQNDYSPGATDVTAWDALKAVVELHKVSDVGLFCDGCARFVEPYPCPTIKAIEKELNL